MDKDKVPLCQLPTPIEPLNLISYSQNRIFIKRDDMTDHLFSGNKARKMEYFMKYILDHKYDYIVSYGSAQSNHCRVVAAAAARFHLPCLLILAKEVEPANYNGNFFLYHLLGAKIRYAEVEQVPETIEHVMQELRQSGHSPFFIEGGGHGNPGTHAYVQAFAEIEMQSAQMATSFDYIFLASGTGTTQAGLIIGKKLSDKQSPKIIGISVARREARGKEVILDSIRKYIMEKELEISVTQDDIIFVDDYIGQGYADLYPDVMRTVHLVSREAAVLLDPVYTGKAFWGMLQYLQIHEIRDCNILFLHTGGIPILYQYASDFQNYLSGVNP